MPPKKVIDSIVYIVDLSHNAETKLELLYKIFAVKYFSQTSAARKDIQTVIFLNKPNGTGIKVVNNWSIYQLDHLEQIKNEFETADDHNTPEDIVNAFVQAIECFEDDLIEGETNKSVVCITDLLSPAVEGKQTEIDYVQSKLLALECWLYCIGPDVQIPAINREADVALLKSAIPNREFTTCELNNLKVLENILKPLNGFIANYDVGFDLLFAYRQEAKTVFASYVNLSIGTELNIPVSVTKTCRDPERLKLAACSFLDDDETVPDVQVFIDPNTMEEIQDSDVITGYRFNGKDVLFNEGEQQTLEETDAFLKCLSIFAFVNANEFSTELYLLADSVHRLTPDTRNDDEDDPDCEESFNNFVDGMRFKNVVALSVRVYNDGYNPNLYCIFPCPDHQNSRCLLMAEFPYGRDFQDIFTRGVPPKQTDDTELKQMLFKYLESVTVDGTNSEMNLLPEFMRVNRSRLRTYLYFAKKHLDSKFDETELEDSVVTMHPLLQNLSADYLEPIKQYYKSLNENKDDK